MPENLQYRQFVCNSLEGEIVVVVIYVVVAV